MDFGKTLFPESERNLFSDAADKTSGEKCKKRADDGRITFYAQGARMVCKLTDYETFDEQIVAACEEYKTKNGMYPNYISTSDAFVDNVEKAIESMCEDEDDECVEDLDDFLYAENAPTVFKLKVEHSAVKNGKCAVKFYFGEKLKRSCEIEPRAETISAMIRQIEKFLEDAHFDTGKIPVKADGDDALFLEFMPIDMPIFNEAYHCNRPPLMEFNISFKNSKNKSGISTTHETMNKKDAMAALYRALCEISDDAGLPFEAAHSEKVERLLNEDLGPLYGWPSGEDEFLEDCKRRMIRILVEQGKKGKPLPDNAIGKDEIDALWGELGEYEEGKKDGLAEDDVVDLDEIDMTLDGEEDDFVPCEFGANEYGALTLVSGKIELVFLCDNKLDDKTFVLQFGIPGGDDGEDFELPKKEKVTAEYRKAA